MWVPYGLHEWHSIAFHKTNMRCICQHVYDLPRMAVWISPLCGCIFPKDKSALTVWGQSSQQCPYSSTVTVFTLKRYMPTSNNGIKLISKHCTMYHIYPKNPTNKNWSLGSCKMLLIVHISVKLNNLISDIKLHWFEALLTYMFKNVESFNRVRDGWWYTEYSWCYYFWYSMSD